MPNEKVVKTVFSFFWLMSLSFSSLALSKEDAELNLKVRIGKGSTFNFKLDDGDHEADVKRYDLDIALEYGISKKSGVGIELNTHSYEEDGSKSSGIKDFVILSRYFLGRYNSLYSNVKAEFSFVGEYNRGRRFAPGRGFNSITLTSTNSYFVKEYAVISGSFFYKQYEKRAPNQYGVELDMLMHKDILSFGYSLRWHDSVDGNRFRYPDYMDFVEAHKSYLEYEVSGQIAYKNSHFGVFYKSKSLLFQRNTDEGYDVGLEYSLSH